MASIGDCLLRRPYVRICRGKKFQRSFETSWSGQGTSLVGVSSIDGHAGGSKEFKLLAGLTGFIVQVLFPLQHGYSVCQNINVCGLKAHSAVFQCYTIHQGTSTKARRGLAHSRECMVFSDSVVAKGGCRFQLPWS